MVLDTLAKKLQALLVSPIIARLERLEDVARVQAVARRQELDRLVDRPRYDDPRCLTRYGYRCFSQNDDDGFIDEIFRRIGTTNRHFVEFGVEGGVENNTLALLLAGWNGLWIEANPSAQAKVRADFAEPLNTGQLVLQPSFATAESIEPLLEKSGVPVEPDLLSIDIDGNDYWVWRAITTRRPRVVVVEYNASLGRSARLIQPYQPDTAWDLTSVFGASLGALEDLGRQKGYALVGCGIRGVNAFFVREDLLADRFLGPYTAETHFEPPRYGPDGAGHPPRWGKFIKP